MKRYETYATCDMLKNVSVRSLETRFLALEALGWIRKSVQKLQTSLNPWVFYRFLLQTRRLLERNAFSGMLCFFQ